MNLINSLVGWHLAQHRAMMLRAAANPTAVQAELLRRLLAKAKDTVWGKRWNYANLKSESDYAQRVPIQDYEQFRPFIQRMMHGERNVLYPGLVRNFSKSSGTTSDKSKFIPVPYENLHRCHIRGPIDTLALWWGAHPQTQLLAGGKGIVMVGNKKPFAPHPQTTIADVSALMLSEMPFYARYFHIPDIQTATMPEWESKIEHIAHAAIHANITNISGVPTWTIVLLRRVLELTGKSNLLEVWKNFELYMHGGVSFTPYREEFKKFFPDQAVQYREIYNASEGFFATQDSDDAEEGMMLLLNNGIYFEFMPLEELGQAQPRALPLAAVEIGRNYAPVITTNGGLWRYLIGDTVRFTTTRPYRLKVTGRTKHFINAFGEEVMVENTDRALALACEQFGAAAAEYTVAPLYQTTAGKGGHEWLVEFNRPPTDIPAFIRALDLHLQSLNSDYEAKRYKSIAIKELSLRIMPIGTFHNWLKTKGKYGGQHKVPRLANHREYLEEILAFAQGTESSNA